MRVSSLIAVIAATSLVAMPVFAASAGNPAAGLSLAGSARTGTATSTKRSSKVGGSSLLLIGLGAAAVIGGAVALGSGHHHHDNTPASS